MQSAHPKTRKRKKSDTNASFVEGKWKEKVQLRRDRAKDQTVPSEAEIQTICIQALESVRNLLQIAPNKDELRLYGNAAEAVVGMVWIIACETVEVLNAIAKKHPECLLPRSRAIFYWPAFISHKRAFALENAKLMKKLELGEASHYSKRQWQVLAPSTHTAFLLFAIAQQMKADLPPLTKKTKRTWFEAGWKYMLELGVVPEKSGYVAQLGKSAIGKRSISRGMSEQTEGMTRDDVRAEIKRQIWNAFDTLITAGSEKN